MSRRAKNADSATTTDDDVFDDELEGAVGDALDTALDGGEGDGGNANDPIDGEEEGGETGAANDGGEAGAATDPNADSGDGFEGLAEALGVGDKPVAAAKPAAAAAGDTAAEPITREDGATWNETVKRWQTKDGAFVEGAPPEPKPAAAAAVVATAGKPGADAKTGEVATAGAGVKQEPTWAPYAVKLDGKDTPLEEVSVSRANGHVYFAVKEDKLARFEQRLQRGAAGERMWRQLDQGLRELEAQKAAPARKTDAEIEAELTMEVIKPYLAEFLDEKDVQLLEAKIENAKMKAAQEYTKSETERIAKATEPTWEEHQANLIVDSMVAMLQTNPALAGLTREEIEQVYEQELLPVRSGIIWKDGEQVVGNTKYIYDRLLAKKTAKGAAAAPPNDEAPAGSAKPAAATSTTPSNDGNSSAPAKKPAAVDNAERFNRGVDNAPKPRTTSVKANRDTTRPPKGTTRDPDDRPRRRSADPRELARVAEDRARKEERNWLRSPTLDVADTGDDDED